MTTPATSSEHPLGLNRVACELLEVLTNLLASFRAKDEGPLVDDLSELVEDIRTFLEELRVEDGMVTTDDLKDICYAASLRVGLLSQALNVIEDPRTLRRLRQWYRLYIGICHRPGFAN
ncbi:MAG: hypothetical protein ACFB9M_15710 [Myxococcota bacterium]